MRDVFISYRRSDTAGHAGRLLDALAKHLDADKFFRDIEGLDAGVDFPEALNRALSQCTAMLVVIGPTWASVATPDGGPRIKQADDFVRQEVAAGLARKDVRVIPVLVGGAQLPRPGELPPDLQELTRRNAFEVSDSRWSFDVRRLATALDPSVKRGLVTPKRLAVLGAAVLAGAAAFGAYRFKLVDFERADDPLALALKEAAIAKANAEVTKAKAEQAEAEARTLKADLEKKQTALEQAKVDARAAAEKAEEGRAVSAGASAEDKAKAEAEAARLAKDNEAAQRQAAAKAAEAEAALAREQQAQAAAKALKERQDEELAAAARTAAVARVAAQTAAAPKAAGAAPGQLSFPGWVLSSGGCGAGQVTVTGLARFSIEKTAEGVVVSEDFRGSGGGFEVQVSGKASFAKEQKSYDIPTQGEWRGSKVFRSAGLDRLNTSDGLTPRTANVVRNQSLCG